METFKELKENGLNSDLDLIVGGGLVNPVDEKFRHPASILVDSLSKINLDSLG